VIGGGKDFRLLGIFKTFCFGQIFGKQKESNFFVPLHSNFTVPFEQIHLQFAFNPCPKRNKKMTTLKNKNLKNK